MELPEQRIISALVLLAGTTFLAVGLYEGQLTRVLSIIYKVITSAIAG